MVDIMQDTLTNHSQVVVFSANRDLADATFPPLLPATSLRVLATYSDWFFLRYSWGGQISMNVVQAVCRYRRVHITPIDINPICPNL